jgi:hypothetical protein
MRFTFVREYSAGELWQAFILSSSAARQTALHIVVEQLWSILLQSSQLRESDCHLFVRELSEVFRGKAAHAVKTIPHSFLESALALCLVGSTEITSKILAALLKSHSAEWPRARLFVNSGERRELRPSSSMECECLAFGQRADGEWQGW